MITYKRYQKLAAHSSSLKRMRDNPAGYLPTAPGEQEGYIQRVMESAPSGSGFDAGTTIELHLCDGNKLVFKTSFHHMNTHGYYDGWTDHYVTVRPDMMSGIQLTITGKDRNQIKDYIHEVFYNWLTEE